jgi:predicted hydrocarbon binding protein
MVNAKEKTIKKMRKKASKKLGLEEKKKVFRQNIVEFLKAFPGSENKLQRYIGLMSERLSDIQRHPALDPIIPAIAPMIVDAIAPNGKAIGEVIQKILNIETPKEAVEWYIAIEYAMGYAEYEIESLDVNKPEVILRANWSPVADFYDREVDFPTCLLLVGITEGVMSVIFDKEMACEETHCKAKGDDYCRFVVRPKKG